MSLVAGAEMSITKVETLEARTMKKVAWRLLPLGILGYVVAYVDRSNISFAALTMNKDLGFTAYIYGLGAGIFFIGYLLFEIPSNLVLERVGARRWIARIMLTWGIASACTALVTGPMSFYCVRFLVGAAEAGFLPGMVLYFTYWFPASYRGRVFAGLYFAQPLANAAAAIASGAILEMNGLFGLKGWQWIFILEAVPAAFLAAAILKWMTDRPTDAKWLTQEEQQWLTETLAAEHRSAEAAGLTTWASIFSDRRVIALSVIWFGTVTANYGILFFMPQLLKELGLSAMMTGLVSAVPYLVGIIGLAVWGWTSDRANERRWHLIVASVLGFVGLAGAGWFGGNYWSVAAMSIAMVGLYGTRAVFWAMPSAFLTGATAAAAFAFINSLSQIGGYVGPFIVGWIKTETNSFEAALYFLGVCSLASAVVALFAKQAASGRKADAA